MLPKNKQHLTRRIHQLTDLAEDQINGYENKKSGWWCEAYNKNSFYINLRNRCIDIFVNDNIDFFGNPCLEHHIAVATSLDRPHEVGTKFQRLYIYTCL